MRNIRKIKRIVQEYETICCFISVLSTLAIQFDAKWFSGIFCNLIQEDYKNIDKSRTVTGVELKAILESFNSTKKSLQCKKSFMGAVSKFKTHQISNILYSDKNTSIWLPQLSKLGCCTAASSRQSPPCPCCQKAITIS